MIRTGGVQDPVNGLTALEVKDCGRTARSADAASERTAQQFERNRDLDEPVLRDLLGLQLDATQLAVVEHATIEEEAKTSWPVRSLTEKVHARQPSLGDGEPRLLLYLAPASVPRALA